MEGTTVSRCQIYVTILRASLLPIILLSPHTVVLIIDGTKYPIKSYGILSGCTERRIPGSGIRQGRGDCHISLLGGGGGLEADTTQAPSHNHSYDLEKPYV